MKSFLNFINKPKLIAVYFLKNFSFLLFIYNIFYKFKNKKIYYQEIEKRKNLSIFNYKQLSLPIPYYPIESIKDSNFYGINHSIKKYIGIQKIKHSFEHGLYFGNYIPFATFLKTTKSIITFSENRKKHLISAGIKKPIYVIGPYIHYADISLTEKEFKNFKQSLGKTFLFFFSHSIKDFNVEIDALKLIKKINKIASNYDTILVCLYYKDILNNIYPKYFEVAGFKIVTAGNLYDINFLSRLKLIIQLADFTSSNSIGTHTGYCVYLNKPHFVIEQKIKFSKDDKTSIIEFRDNDQINLMEKEINEIIIEFSKYSIHITEIQKQIVNKYWGTSFIKNKDELKNLLA
jgi:hypothetical protein